MVKNMKLVNVKKYVNYYKDNYPSLDTLKSVFIVFMVFCCILSVLSIVSQKYICFSILLAYTLIYRISVTIFQKKCKTPYFILRFWVKGTLGTVMAVFFLLVLFTILDVTGRMSVGYVWKILSVYVLILSVLFAATLLCVKFGVYDEKRKKKNKKKIPGKVAVGLISVFAILGMLTSRFFLSSLRNNQDMVIVVLTILVLLLVAICSWGTTEYLRCYFILHYPVLDKNDWEHGSENLMKQPKTKPWIFGRVLTVLGIIVYFTIIIGLIFGRAGK